MGEIRSKQAAMRLSLLASLFLLLARPAVSVKVVTSSLAYCASFNTGSSFSAVTNTYQSNGACQKTCKSYAFGILQGSKCWCSNVAPASDSTSSNSECDYGCPGYPKDSCGNPSKGLYAYVSVSGNNPTSTAGGSSSDTTTSSGTSSGASSTESVTVTASSSSSAASQTLSSTNSDTTTGSATMTTTSGGVVKTITVPAASATSPSSSTGSSGSSSGSSGMSGGTIAGIVVGVIAGLALIGALIFLVFLYRRRAERASSPVPSQDMADRHSRGSSFMRGIFPQGHVQDLAPGASNGLGRQQTFTDNRLRQDSVLYPNGRRNSSVSLQDNEDYSRPVLRLTNPD